VEEKEICRLAGREFNINSGRQLGEVLFEAMKICEKPRKTKTGQYSTDERTLAELAPDHEIVRRLLEYRGMTKLKSTYVDALPAAIWPKTGRVHTTFQQTATSTGRLNSQNPNLQNIPIRTERGREIRKAFVARDADHVLMSADYSQSNCGSSRRSHAKRPCSTPLPGTSNHTRLPPACLGFRSIPSSR